VLFEAINLSSGTTKSHTWPNTPVE